MKKWPCDLRQGAALVAALLSLPSYAEMPAWTWQTSTGFLQMDYIEHDRYQQTRKGFLDTEQGRMPVFRVAVDYQESEEDQEHPLWLQGLYSLAQGNTEYDGHTLQGLVPVQTVSRHQVYDAAARAGVGVRLPQQMQLTPFVEVGWHAWLRELQTYNELYQHEYIAIGSKLTWQAEQWRLSSSVSVGYLVNAMLDTGATRFDIAERPWLRTELGLSYQATRQTQVQLMANYQQYDYGRSPVVGNYYEPDSTSRLSQISLGVIRQF